MSMAKKEKLESLQDNDDANVKYPKGEKAFYKRSFMDELLDSIGEYEIESRDTATYRKMKDDDGQVASSFEILVIAVLAKGFEINYHGKDIEKGAEMVQFLERMYSEINTGLDFRGGFTYAQREMMSSIWAGYHVQEVVWYFNNDLKKVMVKKLKPLAPETTNFLTDGKGNLEGVYQQLFISEVGEGGSEEEKTYGVKIPLERSLILSYKKEGSSYKGRSDFDPIYKYWYLKDFILKFWSIFTERYGAPFLFGTTKKKRMAKFKEALTSIVTRTELVGIFGEDEIKVLETAHDGNHFERFINYCDIQITKGLLVPNLLLDSGASGSGTLGETHFRVFEWRINFIQRMLEEIWNTLNRWAIDLNFKDVDSYPVFNYKPLSELDRRMMAQTLDLLIKNNVVHPTEKWLREMAKLPEADPETIEALDKAWEAKAQQSSFSPNSTEAGISPWAGDNRVQSPSASQLAESIKKRIIKLKLNNPAILQALLQTMEKNELKLAKKLEPRVNKLIDAWVKKVALEAKADLKDENMNLQDYPSWIDGLTPIGDAQLNVIFADWYDDALLDSVVQAENELVSIGMKPSFTARTKTGRIKWIENNLAGLQEGGQQMATFGANKIPMEMYNFVLPYLQESYAAGLQPEQIIDGLKERLGNHYSDHYLRNVARTNMTASINSARLSLYQSRSDFVKGIEFQAILDDRTTPICEQMDGRTFAINDPALQAFTPPLHYQCRSVLSAITVLDIPEGQQLEPTYNPADITESVQDGFGGTLSDLA